jgi:hypothetical protein
MAIAQLYSGSMSVSTTEVSCVTGSVGPDVSVSDGIVQGFFDLADMIAGDILQIRVYEKTRSGDTQRVLYEWVLRDAQSEDLFITPALILMHGWDFTLDALAGTITVYWSIRGVS